MKKNYHAFSLIELSIATLIIGLLVAGVVKGISLYKKVTLVGARNITNSSPVNGIKGLKLWLETTSQISFGQNEPANNDTINNWYDLNLQDTFKRNANAFNNLQENRPIYRESAINNLPALEFDGVDDCMQADFNLNRTKNPNLTIFIVFKNITVGTKAFNKGIIGNGNKGSFARVIFYDPSNIASIGKGSAPNIALNEMNTLNKPYILTHISQAPTTNGSYVFINGSQTATSPFTETLTNTGSSPISIGSFNNCSSSNSLNFSLGEIIIFDRILKTNERQEIEKYLSQKWKIDLI